MNCYDKSTGICGKQDVLQVWICQGWIRDWREDSGGRRWIDN